MDFMTVCISLLAMAVVVMVYLNLSQLMMTRLEISQVSRKYILRMETKGYLDEADKSGMLQELTALGMQKIDLSDSTVTPVAYGDPIKLSLKGTVKGSALDMGNGWMNGFVQREYEVAEKRMSTAKN